MVISNVEKALILGFVSNNLEMNMPLALRDGVCYEWALLRNPSALAAELQDDAFVSIARSLMLSAGNLVTDVEQKATRLPRVQDKLVHNQTVPLFPLSLIFVRHHLLKYLVTDPCGPCIAAENDSKTLAAEARRNRQPRPVLPPFNQSCHSCNYGARVQGQDKFVLTSSADIAILLGPDVLMRTGREGKVGMVCVVGSLQSPVVHRFRTGDAEETINLPAGTSVIILKQGDVDADSLCCMAPAQGAFTRTTNRHNIFDGCRFGWNPARAPVLVLRGFMLKDVPKAAVKILRPFVFKYRANKKIQMSYTVHVFTAQGSPVKPFMYNAINSL
jgi:hypothetical protein